MGEPSPPSRRTTRSCGRPCTLSKEALAKRVRSAGSVKKAPPRVAMGRRNTDDAKWSVEELSMPKKAFNRFGCSVIFGPSFSVFQLHS